LAIFRIFEQRWRDIRDEALALMNSNQSFFKDEAENLKDSGTWKQFEIYSRG
jgi:aspartate beta-hydroxylase